MTTKPGEIARRGVVCFSLVIGVHCMLSAGQAQAPNSGGDVRIQGLLDPVRQKYNLPALAGAIVTSRGLSAAAATGVRKTGADVPVTVEDVWHLGSDTKAMTAVVIASLIEKGQLRWDSSIEEVFPDIAAMLQVEMRKITLLQLLSHRSGLPPNLMWGLFPSKGSIPEQRRNAVKALGSLKLKSEPGTTYEYSNLGYVIAGAMAEKVSGVSWEDLISGTIFGPLKMKSAGFGGTGTPGTIDQPWPHGADGKPTAGNGPEVDNPAIMGPAGAVHCSLADWASFIAEQLRGEQGSGAVLKPATYKILHKPSYGGNYAPGWLATERSWGGGEVWTHAGSNTMNYAVAWVAPLRDFGVLVCTNQGGPTAAKGCDEAASALIALHLKTIKEPVK